MSFVSELYAYLHECPFAQIADNESKIYVNYLSKKPTSIDVQILPAAQIVRQYTDGEAIKQHVFMLKYVDKYEGRDVLSNIGAMEFLENLTNWIESAPLLAPNWLNVEVLTSGRLNGVDDNGSAVYEIQCRVLRCE